MFKKLTEEEEKLLNNLSAIINKDIDLYDRFFYCWFDTQGGITKCKICNGSLSEFEAFLKNKDWIQYIHEHGKIHLNQAIRFKNLQIFT